ncbi:MAG TPA: LytS/YhcK type 5TM receptor domain-containing protein, partial [Ignavibacteriaceae bacterium]
MIIIDLIYNLSVLIALSVLSGFIDLRFNRTQLKGKIFQGLLFGITSIVGMLYPFKLAEGIIFDGRSIIIGLCTLFFGPISGSIASIMAIVFRNYLGGGGALTGSLVIISSFLIGYYFFFRRNKFPEKDLSKKELYVFGLIINVVMLLLFLTIPYPNKLEMFKILTPTVLGIYPFATLLIGKILLDQEENQSVLKKLKESEELFRTTLYSIGDAVITTDISGNVRQMNSVAERLTGRSEVESKGNPLENIFNIVDENTKVKVESPLSKILREGTVVGLTNHTL